MNELQFLTYYMQKRRKHRAKSVVIPEEPQVTGDPDFTNVTLLMHMDGANLGTTFTDVTGKTVTNAGGTTTETAIKQFGTASGRFGETNSGLTIPASADFDFGTGEFTVEWFQYWYATPISFNTFYNNNYATDPNLLAQTANGERRYIVYMAGSSSKITEATSAPLNTWIHYAIVRSGTTVTMYRNGVVSGSVVYAGPVGNSVVDLRLGFDASYGLTSNIDELRVTKGVARYTAPFTPPTQAFFESV